MAEARLAVAFQFAVTDEGVVVNVDKEVVKLMARSAYKSVKRRCKYARNTILKGVYPASPATWMFVLAAVLAARHHQHEVTMDMLGRMERGFPGCVFIPAHLRSPFFFQGIIFSNRPVVLQGQYLHALGHSVVTKTITHTSWYAPSINMCLL